MPEGYPDIFVIDEGPELFAKAVEHATKTGKGVAIHGTEWNPDAPDVIDPVAYIIPSSSSIVFNNKSAELQYQANELQVAQGYQATRVNAMEMAIKAWSVNDYGTPSASGLTALASAIEKFLLDGTVAEPNGLTHGS